MFADWQTANIALTVIGVPVVVNAKGAKVICFLAVTQNAKVVHAVDVRHVRKINKVAGTVFVIKCNVDIAKFVIGAINVKCVPPVEELARVGTVFATQIHQDVRLVMPMMKKNGEDNKTNRSFYLTIVMAGKSNLRKT